MFFYITGPILVIKLLHKTFALLRMYLLKHVITHIIEAYR